MSQRRKEREGKEWGFPREKKRREERKEQRLDRIKKSIESQKFSDPPYSSNKESRKKDSKRSC